FGPGAAAGQREISRSQQGGEYPPELAGRRGAAWQPHQFVVGGFGEAGSGGHELGQGPPQLGVGGGGCRVWRHASVPGEQLISGGTGLRARVRWLDGRERRAEELGGGAEIISVDRCHVLRKGGA